MPKYRTARARKLRKESTIPERILWGLLRDGQIGGLKFRRQHPVGPFVVDFYCAAAGLAVELDGMTHVGQGEADDRRTALLARQGVRVIRVTNDEVLGDNEAVVNFIAREAGLDW